MKKILLIIIVMIFAANVRSADYLETFVDYRWSMRRALGIDTTSQRVLDDTTANQFIRESVNRVLPTLRPRLIEDTVVISQYDNTYSLDTLTIGISSVEWRRRDSVKSFIYAPRSVWYQLDINPNIIDEENPYDQRPSYYDYTDSLIFLYPVPAIASDTVYVLSWYKVPAIISADNLINIPVQFRTAVLRYAIYLVAQSRRHPLTELYLKDYETMIAVLNRAYPRIYQPQIHPDSGYFGR